MNAFENMLFDIEAAPEFVNVRMIQKDRLQKWFRLFERWRWFYREEIVFTACSTSWSRHCFFPHIRSVGVLVMNLTPPPHSSLPPSLLLSTRRLYTEYTVQCPSTVRIVMSGSRRRSGGCRTARATRTARAARALRRCAPTDHGGPWRWRRR